MAFITQSTTPLQLFNDFNSEDSGSVWGSNFTGAADGANLSGILLSGPASSPSPGAGRTGRAMSPACTMYDFIMEAVAMCILCVFGFTGNTLSMVCLSREKSKTATPLLLVSLEVADTLFLVTVFLLRVAVNVARYLDWTGINPLFPYLGKYVFPCALIAEMGTIYLTVLVTVNRYISVCHPYDVANLCSKAHAQKHVILVAVVSIVYNLPRFFESNIVEAWDPFKNRTVNVIRMSDFGNNKYYQIIYCNAFYFIVMFLVPLVSLIILNSRLVVALKRTKQKRAQMMKSRNLSSVNSSRSEDDITLVLIVVVLVFVVCQTPALITQLLFSLMSPQERNCPSAFFYYERVSDLMVVTNSSINFIIYCFCSNKFRQILITLVCPSSGKLTRGSPSNLTEVNGAQKTMVMETQAICESIGPDENDDLERNGQATTEESLL